MLLAIDAGNTNVVFALYDGEELLQMWRISTKDTRTADEYMVWLSQLMRLAGVEPDQVSGAIIATVVPQALFHLKGLCRTFFGTEPIIVNAELVDLGIAVRIENPREVGADRLVNAVAAHRSYPGALIVIDFGTATTFDVVDEQGAYCGGVISPGINLSMEALHMAAAKLPHIAIERPAKVIGTSTIPAMQSGVYWGYVGLIEGLVTRIRAEFGRPMTVIATGGLAPIFAGASDIIQHVDRDLTLRGLHQIYERNKDQDGRSPN